MSLAHQTYYIRHFVRDLFIVAGSIFLAFLLTKAGLIDLFIQATSGSKAFSAFIAGGFFTSVFTVAPATVALAAIGGTFSPVLTAFFGAIGAAMVDMLIISFVSKDLTQDIDEFRRRLTFKHHLIKAFHFGFLKWAAFLIGIIFVATPLPDEPGLILIGLSKISPRLLPLVFFVSHFLGILAVVSIASAL